MTSPKLSNNIAIIGLGKTGQSFLDFLLFDQNYSNYFFNHKDKYHKNQNIFIKCKEVYYLCNNFKKNIILYDENEKLIKELILSYQNKINTDKILNINLTGCILPKTLEESETSLLNYGINIILCSPGIPFQPEITHPILTAAYNLDIKFISDIDLFYIFNSDANYVGITGSNGKSTVVSLLEEVFNKAIKNHHKLNYNLNNSNFSNNIEYVFVGGNLGNPVLYSNRLSKGLYIFELSSYQIDYIKYAKFDVVACLNIKPDHLDRYGTIDHYVRSKNKIFSLLKENGKIILSEEMINFKKNDLNKIKIDKINNKIVKTDKTYKRNINEYSLITHSDIHIKIFCSVILCSAKKISLDFNLNFLDKSNLYKLFYNSIYFPLIFEWNNILWKNWINDYQDEYIYDINKYKILCHSFNEIDKKFKNYSDINNNFKILNTVPGKHNSLNIAVALAVALQYNIKYEDFFKYSAEFKSLPHRLQIIRNYNGVLYINDSKATNIDSTEKALSMFSDKSVHLIIGGITKNEDLSEISYLFEKIIVAYLIGKSSEEFATVFNKYNVKYYKCITLDNALEKSKIISKQGEIVLLSPACSSHDQWRNFEERGNAFINIVNNW
ncbi:Mur ligase family protein [Lyticum sinuosum]|uniref:UDP-N-acetylmuramoylalanine--D-glutamate ligase n=1 Tax=Lyticum sinuosum TaxID=1332059 RepID=A0AAE4VM78_9RICK|nr:Mur ligase family protein [Lyticum sinuosum]MDZ5761516.1 UDP-N-acetylmuramoylalanine--D-glutamate ligase [Lyticum sinuosum]